MSRQRRFGAPAAAVLATLFCLGSAGAVYADRLDGEMLRSGPVVMNYLRAHGYKTAVVLPFRVLRGDAPLKIEHTPLERNLAERLERSLILSYDPERPVMVLSQAQSVMERQFGLAEARRADIARARLFGLKFPLPLAVENRLRAPDVFLTGRAQLSRDLATTTVTILAFDRQRAEGYEPVHSFTVPTGRSILADAGQGFSLSHRFSGLSRGSAVEANREMDVQATASSTTAEGEFPVELRVLYGDQSQSLNHDSAGGAYNFAIGTPTPGQQVILSVRNRTKDKLGIVLTVNGVNTLYEEQGLEPTQMSYWTLEPGVEYYISGFYKADGKTYRSFTAVSEEQSQRDLAQIGRDMAGLIQLHVLRSSPVGMDVALAMLAARGDGNLRHAVTTQTRQEGPATTWDQLREQIAAQAQGSTPRGLVAPGEEKAETIRHDTFTCPFHTDTLVIRYWNAAQ